MGRGGKECKVIGWEWKECNSIGWEEEGRVGRLIGWEGKDGV